MDMAVIALANIALRSCARLVDGIQVEKVLTVSRSKSGNVWI
jgi:hypothetical protein